MQKKNGFKGSLNENNLSFPKFVVGNLPLSKSFIKEEKQPYVINQVEDPRQRLSGMTSFFDNGVMGFTLIELLVVVLIIGILAAVALPQYQKAVGKARVVQAITSLKALIDAEEVYYMTNGVMASDLSELDVTIENTPEYSFVCNQTPFGGSCGATPIMDSLPVLEFFPSYNPNYAGKHWCQVHDSTQNASAKAKAIKICKTFGPKDPLITHGDYYIIQ